MRGLNRLQIIGNLGADPDMRHTTSGRALTRFRVAVERRWRDAEGTQQNHVEWFRVVTWGRQAEIAAQYLEKGSPVYVEGRLENRSFEGTDGETVYITELVAREFILLPRGNGRKEVPLEVEEGVAEEIAEVPV